MKSGNITIKLGPLEVKQILENPVHRRSFGYISLDDKLGAKIYKATSEKFTNVKAEMAQEIQAHQILTDTRNTPERNKAVASYDKKRKAIVERHQVINNEYAKAIEELTQTAFDKAGITEFVAEGTHFRRVVQS